MRLCTRLFCIAILSLSSSFFAVQVRAADDAKNLEFFEAKIRPVLVKHCYECHADNGKEAKGGLFLDTAAGVLTGGDSGPTVVSGKPDGSPLIEAIRYDGLEMPPAGKLPKSVIADFERWIRLGAVDPRKGKAPQVVHKTIDIEQGRKFWSFQPLKKPSPKKVTDTAWPQSNIDTFVLAKLEAVGLKPSSDADRRTLVRRVYFDLIGLPPKPKDVDKFVNDSSPQAFSNLVDQLLNSPQFGVHWARHWLDVARYADSNGGDFNATFHDAWRYRDYVVNAFNNDKPYDQFIREQIAGDLLPFDSDQQCAEQMIATGFLMVGTKMLSERDKEKLRMDVVDEQINTVGSAFMGMTLGCCRCHDHKFDPIPTADYYALAGIFRSTKTLEGESAQYVSTWTRRNLPAKPEHQAAVDTFKKEKAVLQKQIKKNKTQLDQVKTKLAQFKTGLIIDDSEAIKHGDWKSSTHSKGYVGAGYLHDDRTGKGEKSVEFPVKISKSARYDVRVSYTPGSGRDAKVPVIVRHAKGETEVILNQQPKPTIDNLFASIGQFEFDTQKPASVTILTRGTTGHVIADAVQLVEFDSAGKPVIAKPSKEDKPFAEAQKTFDATQAELKAANKKLKQLEANAPKPLPQVFAADEFKEIDDCEIRVRGEHKNKGPLVKRGFLQVATTASAPQFDKKQSGRRELADWIADPNHPLTSRVIVNRIWYHLIGQGIVASVDNFGKLGDRPTHPELLDSLASDFIEDGRSIKQAIRRIVLSHTYRMSSGHREASWNIDPENQLLWRANRRRLPAEAIRDSMLSLSGQLDLQPGDSPVPGLGTLVTTNSATSKGYERKQTNKRSLYLPIIRNELPPILTLFDFADPDLVTGKRAVTNVPAQALLLMNSPFVMDCSNQMAAKLLISSDETPRQLVDAAYRSILSRPPTSEESERAVQFLSQQLPAENAEGNEVDARKRSLSQFIHVLFASTEFRLQG